MTKRIFITVCALFVALGSFGFVSAQHHHSHDEATPAAGEHDHNMNMNATPEASAMSMGAFYFKVTNHGDSPDTLLGIESDIADTVEIHEVEMNGNVMSMNHQQDGVEIPAHGEVVFEPGSWHVMLIGINKSLISGEEFTATLTFEHAGNVEITVPISVAEPKADEFGDPVSVGESLEITNIWARQAPKVDGVGTPIATPED